jgi:uncharacterized surface protein with fasciclin (FAS1) repeats
MDESAPLAETIEAAGLDDAFATKGQEYTFFVPSEKAVDRVREEYPDYFEADGRADLFAKLHVHEGSEDLDALVKAGRVKTVAGVSFPVEKKGDEVSIGGAKVLHVTTATDGFVIQLDGALIPEFDSPVGDAIESGHPSGGGG